MTDTQSSVVENPPSDLKPYHCGWHGGLTRSCPVQRGGCGRRFSKKKGDWHLVYCPDCGTDRYCRLRIASGKKKCKHHGSGTKERPGGRPKSANGMFAPSLKGTGYLEDYERLLENERYLELKEYMAVVHSRVAELARRTQSLDSSKAWAELESNLKALINQRAKIQLKLDSLIRASNSQDWMLAERRLDELATLVGDKRRLEDLDKTIQEGKEDWTNWQDLLSTVEQYRKLQESERRLMTDMNQILTLQQAMELFQAMIADIRDVIDDPEKLSAIGYKMMSRLSDKDKRIRELPFVVHQEVAE